MRQVLLHRPDPRAVHAGRGAAADLHAERRAAGRSGAGPKFRALVGAGAKPFECVGEVSECRAAVLLAARRADRTGCLLLQDLAVQVASWPDAPSAADAAAMLAPTGNEPGNEQGANFIPAGYQ